MQLAFHLAVGSDLGRGDEQEEQQAGGCNGEEEQQDQRRAGEEGEPGFQVYDQKLSESSLLIQVSGADDKKSFAQLVTSIRIRRTRIPSLPFQPNSLDTQFTYYLPHPKMGCSV